MSELYSNYLPNLERIRGPETPLEQLEKQVRFRTLSDHFKFDTEKWERPSFHNETHISSTWHGIDSLFRTYNNDENARVLPEYLNPKVQLERYNQMIAMKYLHLRNPEQMMIREDELESLMKIVFDIHDTGNIKEQAAIHLSIWTSTEESPPKTTHHIGLKIAVNKMREYILLNTGESQTQI